MILSRNIALIGHFILDECLPPVIRDSKAFMWLLFRLMFGDQSDTFFEFKDRAPSMSREEFRRVYRDTRHVHLQRETDINRQCLARILATVEGPKVLDIACGRGYLAARLAERGFATTGADFVVADDLAAKYPAVTFEEADIEAVPYGEGSFDTVICTHTLEHVRDFDRAVAELRRVAGKRLIVVVPRQRKYRYTFDLHLHFFTYPHELRMRMGAPAGAVCEALGGDLFYLEDRLVEAVGT